MKDFGKTKQKALRWIKKHKRFPKRSSLSKREKALALRFNNLISPSSPSYDKGFRELLEKEYGLAPYRSKRKSDIRGKFKELIEFMTIHKRRPSIGIPEERLLAYDYIRFTNPSSSNAYKSTRRINQIKSIDKCFRTGIKTNLRPIINKALDLAGEKPIYDLVSDGEVGKSLYLSDKSGMLYKLDDSDSLIEKLNLIRLGDY
jgi:hypothetical protein